MKSNLFFQLSNISKTAGKRQRERTSKLISNGRLKELNSIRTTLITSEHLMMLKWKNRLKRL